MTSIPRWIRGVILAQSFYLLSGCCPQSLFYYPNKRLYVDPANMGLKYDTIQYPSLNGKTLWAIFIPTDQPSKGTVVHFHGNYGNLSNHFPLAVFLVKQGYDVLSFDYEGYGASQGHPTPQDTVEDGIATVRYAQTHLRNPRTGVVVFGQSLGGAIAIVVAAKEPEVKGAVIESAFSSYKRMGREALQRSAWTWLIAPLASVFLSDTYAPIRYVAEISPRPILLIHGDHDHIVPMHMSQDLYAQAREPKTLWIVPGADHLECRKIAGKEYDEKIAGLFAQSLNPPPASNGNGRRGDQAGSGVTNNEAH